MQIEKVKNNSSEIISTILDTCVHLLIYGLVCCILWIPIIHYRQLLSWHAILGTIGILLLFSESITILSNNVWYTNITRQTKIKTHGILLGLATFSVLLGSYFEYYRKAHKPGHNHFDSFHGVTALTTTLLSLLACIGGLAAANHEWFQAYIINIRPVVLKLSHNIIGLTAYFTGMVSICCAYYSKWVVSHTNTEERIILVIVTMSISLWTLKHPLVSLYQQINALRQ